MAILLQEDEVNWARRAFPETQQLLNGVPLRQLEPYTDVGWYDTRAHPEAGAFAVVRTDGPHTDLVGEILRVTYERRSVLVYCVDFADVPQDISLYRRAFLAVSVLARESVPCVVEVVA